MSKKLSVNLSPNVVEIQRIDFWHGFITTCSPLLSSMAICTVLQCACVPSHHTFPALHLLASIQEAASQEMKIFAYSVRAQSVAHKLECKLGYMHAKASRTKQNLSTIADRGKHSVKACST